METHNLRTFLITFICGIGVVAGGIAGWIKLNGSTGDTQAVSVPATPAQAASVAPVVDAVVAPVKWEQVSDPQAPRAAVQRGPDQQEIMRRLQQRKAAEKAIDLREIRATEESIRLDEQTLLSGRGFGVNKSDILRAERERLQEQKAHYISKYGSYP
jgi:hypothetical protein